MGPKRRGNLDKDLDEAYAEDGECEVEVVLLGLLPLTRRFLSEHHVSICDADTT